MPHLHCHSLLDPVTVTDALNDADGIATNRLGNCDTDTFQVCIMRVDVILYQSN